MKILAEILITPTYFELASLNFVRINFRLSPESLPKDLLIPGSYDFSKFQNYFFKFLNKNSPKIQMLSWRSENLCRFSS